MDAKRLKFLMDVQGKIDSLESETSIDDKSMKELKDKFYRLSQNELKEKNEINIEKINKIASNTEIIRNVLSIKGEVSISYDFIKNDRVRKQLIIDNLRMENVRLNLEMQDLDRFHEFCVNAFYQIEELINYYFYSKFPIFKEFINYAKIRNPKAILDNKENINGVEIGAKIFLFESEHYHKIGVFFESTLDKIRLVRNENLHRCTIIVRDNQEIESKASELRKKIAEYNKNNVDKYLKSKEEVTLEKSKKLIDFLKTKDYDVVRDTIIKLVNTIRQVINS